MSGFVANTANVAMYALAALPFIALGVARAEPATVKISDLNMSRPAQVQMFNDRVEHAANHICANYADPRNISAVAVCTSAVRAEAADKLAQSQAQLSVSSVASR